MEDIIVNTDISINQEKQPIQKIISKVYTVLQWYNYRKEQYIKVLGVFDTKAQANKFYEDSFELCQKKSWGQKTKFLHKMNGLMSLIHVSDPDNQELTTFRIEEINTNLKVSQETLIYVNAQYQVPIWGDKSQEPLGSVIEVFTDRNRCTHIYNQNECFSGFGVKGTVKPYFEILLNTQYDPVL